MKIDPILAADQAAGELKYKEYAFNGLVEIEPEGENRMSNAVALAQPQNNALSAYGKESQVMELANRMLSFHPQADAVGSQNMIAVAQMALLSGASPMPGTNGIHVWKQGDKVLFQFGIGFWRGKAEAAGGIAWTDRPRPMTKSEKAERNIPEATVAYICKGSLWRDIKRIRAEYAEFGEQITMKEAKMQTFATGEGILVQKDYAKNGRSKNWTADLRAERDLYRRLLPEVAMVEDNSSQSGGPMIHGDTSDYLSKSKVQKIPIGVGEDVNDLIFGGDNSDRQNIVIQPPAADDNFISDDELFSNGWKHVTSDGEILDGEFDDPLDFPDEPEASAGLVDTEYMKAQMVSAETLGGWAMCAYQLNRDWFDNAVATKKFASFLGATDANFDAAKLSDCLDLYVNALADQASKKEAANAAKGIYNKEEEEEGEA